MRNIGIASSKEHLPFEARQMHASRIVRRGSHDPPPIRTRIWRNSPCRHAASATLPAPLCAHSKPGRKVFVIRGRQEPASVRTELHGIDAASVVKPGCPPPSRYRHPKPAPRLFRTWNLSHFGPPNTVTTSFAAGAEPGGLDQIDMGNVPADAPPCVHIPNVPTVSLSPP